MGRKKKVYEKIKITGFADKGKGVGRTEDGKVLFVDNVVPGDIVDVQVRRKKSSYYLCMPKTIHHYSEDRVEPFCEHFGICGGCKLQYYPYEKQIEEKENTIRQAFRRIGKVEVGEFFPIIPAPKTRYYRNKLEFTFSNKRWLEVHELGKKHISPYEDVLGFHRPAAYDKIVDIKHCYLQPDPSNALRLAVKAIAKEMELGFYDLRTHEGLMRHVIFRTTTLGEIMVVISFLENNQEQIQGFFEKLIALHPEITCAYYCINGKTNDYVLDLDMIHQHGKEWIEEELRNVRFRIGPKSFFQTNSEQAVNLFNVVEDFAGLTGNENVYDLYTGIGSIALYVAHKCKQVVGIEEVELAIEDAKVNMQVNDIDNAVFYAGDVKNILTTEFADKHGKPDVLITDPPRAGMHPKVVQMLLELEAPKVVYVSCNPATQARDLNILSEKYDVEKSQAVDMFPHTYHIENVVLLKLKTKSDEEE